MKTISKTAVAVAAGMLFSMGSALAADLGGNCCADLEERVAELEATTARKGNRKVSLTISGQVNKMIMAYSDGGPAGAPLPTGATADRDSNTFWGIDNTNSSTRFNLGGRAKIDGTRNAGFNITIEVNSGARSAAVRQDRGEVGASGTNFGRDDHALGMRDANVWLEDTRLGRVTLGRLTQTGPQGTIDLGGIGVIAPGTSLVGNALYYRGAPNANFTIGAGLDNAADTNKRIDGIRYESPTWQGFQLAATYGEVSNTLPFGAATATPGGVGDLGNAYAVNLRYANEFNGVRVAAAIGYERLQEDGFVSPAGSDKRHFGLSGSLMHVATGLFVQSGWTKIETIEGDSRDGTFWHIAAGVTRNWFGIGNTSLYGEFGQAKDMFFTHRVAGAILGDDSRFWGLGMVQNIDAAAMELYMGYRSYSADLVSIPTEDISVFAAGARIKF